MVRAMRYLLLLLVAAQASAETLPVGHGWVARTPQSHQGLPVIGADLVVRVAEDGRVLRQRGRHVDLAGFDVTPGIAAARAVEIAHAPSGGAVKTQLAIDPDAAGGPRLVWAVRGTPIPELLENAVYLVDAKSGQLLKRIDLIKRGKASVFLQNPVE